MTDTTPTPATPARVADARLAKLVAVVGDLLGSAPGDTFAADTTAALHELQERRARDAQPHDRERADRIERAAREVLRGCSVCNGRGQYEAPCPWCTGDSTYDHVCEHKPRECRKCKTLLAALAAAPAPAPRVDPPGVVEALRALLDETEGMLNRADNYLDTFDSADLRADISGYFERKTFPPPGSAAAALAAHDARQPVQAVPEPGGQALRAVLAEVGRFLPFGSDRANGISVSAWGPFYVDMSDREQAIQIARQKVYEVLRLDREAREKGATQ